MNQPNNQIRIALGDGDSVLVEPTDLLPGSRPAGGGPDAPSSLFEVLTPAVEAARSTLKAFGRDNPDELEIEFGVKITPDSDAVISKTADAGHFKVKISRHKKEEWNLY